ncbi:hypothetical protein QCA50_009065 [Cerrena zonata]|uniref:Uncharacterized protein n=1 Tax=Cerrena zonata TaxID=2478898 RepID=A0AAW0G3J3_9APHY
MLTRPPNINRDDRTSQRTYIRQKLGDQFRQVAYIMKKRTKGVPRVPWKNPDKLREKYRVAIFGWPLSRPFVDPSKLRKEELWVVVCAVHHGTLWFGGFGERGRKQRSDVGEYRGRRPYSPAARQTFGGYLLTPPIVNSEPGEPVEDPIEDFSD